MAQTEPTRLFLLVLLAVAAVALTLIPALLLSANMQTNPTNLRRPLLNLAYTIICAGGIAAIFYPNKCRMMFQKPAAPNKENGSATSALELKGHHPDCENYSANRITIRNRVFCAGCGGLLIGAIVALIVVVFYSLGVLNVMEGTVWIIGVGEGLMLAGLAQIRAERYVKLAMNAFFVVGSAVMLVWADWAKQSLLVDGYVLGVILFMLWLRILLSEYNNDRTCLACGHCS